MSRKRGGTILLLLGVVIAVGVAFMVFNQARRAAETARMESVEVLVAAQDIPERTLLIAPFLATKRMLPTSLPPAALGRPEDAIGKMTIGPILAGEFVLPGKLVEADGRSGLTFTVPKGKVVITLPASDILTTGAVRPGDHVDLLVTIKPPDKQNAPPSASQAVVGAAQAPQPTAVPTPSGEVDTGTTQTTMQNLKVLAIGSVQPAAVASDESKTKSATDHAPSAQSLITFAVDRQDALTLKALKDSERVKLELVLRGAADEELGKTDPVTLQTIVDRYRFRAVPTPRAQGGVSG
jgi:Flp pilus assembly protein CpaB